MSKMPAGFAAYYARLVISLTVVFVVVLGLTAAVLVLWQPSAMVGLVVAAIGLVVAIAAMGAAARAVTAEYDRSHPPGGAGPQAGSGTDDEV